jgi:hypothetical protein
MAVQGSSRLAPFDMLRKINKEKKMAQDTAKKAGKRTQAVNEKKEAILAAALETFSLYGIHGTRIEKVAERAGVSKTNLLYYYPSKRRSTLPCCATFSLSGWRR